jgi:hypothetical protein
MSDAVKTFETACENLFPHIFQFSLKQPPEHLAEQTRVLNQGGYVRYQGCFAAGRVFDMSAWLCSADGTIKEIWNASDEGASVDAPGGQPVESPQDKQDE